MTTTTKKTETTCDPALIVNSLGEVYRRDAGQVFSDTLMGGINLSAAARLYLTPEEQDEWKTFQGDRHRLLDAYICERAYRESLIRLAEQHGKDVWYFVKRVHDYQVIDDGQFRVWGEKLDDGPEHIWLVTEFQQFVDEEDFWSRLEAFIESDENLEMRVMHEMERLEQSWKHGVNGVDIDDRSTITDETAIYGNDHGRMERQVEVRMDIAELTRARHWGVVELFELVAEIREKTETFWKEAAVSVG